MRRAGAADKHNHPPYSPLAARKPAGVSIVEIAFPASTSQPCSVAYTKTNSVEHPELVAERLERFANIVGKERVIAATDCGFATFVGFHPCHPEAAWLKLRALVEGAQLASQHLW
jgi:hypothetical protein